MLNCHVHLKPKKEYIFKNDCYVTASSGEDCLPCLEMDSGKPLENRKSSPISQLPKVLNKSLQCVMQRWAPQLIQNANFTSDTNFTLGYQNFES